MLRLSLYRTIPQTLLSLALALSSASVLADNTAQTLPFYQDWSDGTLITAADDWSTVPGITGYTGEELANTSEVSSVNPQIVVDGTNSTAQVIPFYFDPNDVAHVGIGEFSIFLGQVVVMRGSPSTDAPFLLININTTGQDNIRVRYTLQDKDPSSRNAVTQVALQYRIGTTGNFTNIPEAYVADATEPNAATKTTEVAVMLPSAVNDKPHIQLRIITTNYVYTPPPIDLPDEWVGIGNIDIAGNVPVLSIGDSNATELDAAGCPVPMMFTVTSDRPAPLGDIAFTYSTLSGTATGNEDYTHVGPGSGNGVIFQNNTSAMITMDILCDDISEPNETFTVALGSPPDLSYLVANQPEPFINGIGIGTIIDGDRPVLSIADSNVLEGNSPGCPNTQMIFTVTSDVIATSDIDFGYTALSFTGDTATQDVDYTEILLGAGAGTISIGTNSTTIPVNVTCDTNIELNEQFSVRLTGGGITYSTGPDAKGTILDDDGPIVSISDVTQAEGNAGTTDFVFRLQLSEAPPFDLDFSISTQDGTASAGNDYEELGGSLMLPQGATFVDFTVDVYGDTTLEPNETFTVNVTSPMGNQNLTATGTILNDDGFTASIADVALPEGNAGTSPFTFTVQLSEAPPSDFTFLLSTANGSATASSDYTAINQVVTIPTGQTTSEPIQVFVNGDTTLEPNETFTVTFSNGNLPFNVPASDLTATGTIINDDGFTASIADVALPEGNAGTSSFTFTVQLSEAPPSDFTFLLSTTNGSATADSDYTAVNQMVTIHPGETSAPVTVFVNGDTDLEPNETFTVALSNGNLPFNVPASDLTATGTIIDDDHPHFSVSNSSVFEGTACGASDTEMEFTVTSDVPVGANIDFVYITLAGGTATADVDYNSLDLGSPGEGSMLVGESVTTITVSIVCDSDIEPDETFTVALIDGDNNNLDLVTGGVATGTILNDDAPPPPPLTLRIDDASLFEGNAGTTNMVFTVSLDQPVPMGYGNVSVDYATANNTATAGADFSSANGTIIFLEGEESHEVFVPITGDANIEPNETFFVNLNNVQGANVSIADDQGIGTITDDDAVALTLSIDDVSLVEGDGGVTNMVFTVSLDQPVPVDYGDVSVDYATVNNTATTGNFDFINTNGTLTFLEGEQSHQLSVPIIGDTTLEPDETFFVNLSNAQGANVSITDAQGIGTIADDDAVALTLSIDDISLVEGNGGITNMVFTVSLNQPVPLGYGNVSVDYATTDGTATSPSDYTGGNGTLVFPENEQSQQVVIPIIGDINPEADETFFVNLSNAVGTNVSIIDNQGIGTITNDDAVALTLRIDDTSLFEGNAGTTNMVFTVSLDPPVPAGYGNVSVDYATANGGTATAGGDYTITSGTLTFSEGEESDQVFVPIIGDATPESDETLFINLNNVQGANVSIADGQGIGTIIDDDAIALTLRIDDTSLFEGNAGTTNMVFTVSLGQPVPMGYGNVSVGYATANNTATAGADFSSANGTIIFLEGEESHEVFVPITGDANIEPNETFFVNLNNVQGANVSIADAQATGTILNDDGLGGTTFSINANSAEIYENNGTPARAYFTVSALFQVPLPAGTFTVDVAAAASSTATPDQDFVFSPEVVELSPDHPSQIVVVDIIDDNLVEGTESVVLELMNADSSAGEGVAIGNGNASTNILDDESVTEATFVIGDAEPVYEGNGVPPDQATFPITLILPDPDALGPFSVDVSSMLIGSADTDDFTPVAQTLLFTADTLQQTVLVDITDDDRNEYTETFTLELSHPAGAVIGDGSGLGTILDNDRVTVPTFLISHPGAFDEGIGGVTATISLLLPAGVTGNFGVLVNAVDSIGIHAAEVDSDYTFAAQPSIQLSDTNLSAPVVATLIDDTTGEATESFTLRLSQPINGAVIGDGIGVITILDNDGGIDPNDTFADGFEDGFE